MRRSLRQKSFDWLLAFVSRRRRAERLVASSGLFDAAWYVENNPDAKRFPGGPLRHFMRRGACELRDPNPFFDAAWYCAQCPEALRANALVHYLERGAAQGLRPSPAFDPAWYRAAYPDVAAAGVEPLAHFLGPGRPDGRFPSAPADFRPVEEAELLCLKPPTIRETVALFVTYAPRGSIKAHVPPFLSALAEEGIATTLIVAADQPDDVAVGDLGVAVDGLFLRRNSGFDFAAWAHVSRGLDFSRARRFFLINDSVVGPLNTKRFSALVSRIGASNAHLVGLTESLEVRRHFQSYFLAAKGEGVPALLDVLAEVRAYGDKRAAIVTYELPMLDRFLQAGLRAEALFSASTNGNATIENWRELIALGFPFVKVAALRSAKEGWREVLAAEGYDPRLAEDAVAFQG
jgi:Rhamnan synthesis protein F